jgi:hypothetical protein
MAQIVKMPNEEIVHNIRRSTMDKARDAKKKAQEALEIVRRMEERKVQSGRFNQIKGFDKLKVG